MTDKSYSHERVVEGPNGWRSIERLVTGAKLWEPDTSGRRFYEVCPDFNFTPWFDMPNETDLRAPILRLDQSARNFSDCLKDHDTLPHLKIMGHRKRLPDIHFYAGLFGVYILSDRAKALFETIDSEGFAFRPMRATYGRRTEIPGAPYWLCKIPRALDCVDEERSEYMESRGTGDFASSYGYISIYLARMKLDVVGNAHAFGLIRHSVDVFDDVLVDAIRAKKLTGAIFRDFQDVVSANKQFGRGEAPPLQRPS